MKQQTGELGMSGEPAGALLARLQEWLAAGPCSSGERQELTKLNALLGSANLGELRLAPLGDHTRSLDRKAIHEPSVLNEAPVYGSAFSRGLRIELGDYVLLFISGTASIDEEGRTVYPGDFRAQCWRTYRNITELLASEGASWRDVVKCTCYLRDIERDYEEFNRVRSAFFAWMGLDPMPASVGVQVRLCRDDLLVEIEALAFLRKAGA
ncbi:MAG TPA: Rid family hydrolase [Acidobacteriota bacterium]|jgi:enamine deaminase RidA (YjgF/YER057c/UK114 family)|nr:Rid family hydrolase [Acidobacteriota bacterium]HRR56390.1 Rid family hydrolase [Acidobacteriota bacterium]HRV07778.1 Rid family hydrolase [Acidobacteriota bacterium]